MAVVIYTSSTIFDPVAYQVLERRTFQQYGRTPTPGPGGAVLLLSNCSPTWVVSYEAAALAKHLWLSFCAPRACSRKISEPFQFCGFSRP